MQVFFASHFHKFNFSVSGNFSVLINLAANKAFNRTAKSWLWFVPHQV